MTLRDHNGGVATLGPRLGEGGEGAVFRIVERPGYVAKIYNRTMSPYQIAKLQAMVHAGDDGLRTVAAWPTGLVYDRTRPVGFTMPLLAAQHPLHELLGPRSRQEHFPEAHWKFLVHTGTNLARAFAVLHERNVVVGDVNSNNVVVGPDSTAHLIDCDSFQVRTRDGVFRCNVGVPDYQPPELQTANFATVDRLPQHDLFGLAVMLFQLLFVGRHPFAGVLPPGLAAAGGIGANVAARRFFYGPLARRGGLRPPPGSPTLTAVTPELAQLFNHAFLGSPADRPSAETWCAALEDLETRTVACTKNPAHRHVRDAACPWCALERAGLYYFSSGRRAQAYGVNESIWERCNNAEAARLWAQIAAVRPPAPVPTSLGTAAPAHRATLNLWSRGRVRAFVAGAVVAVITIAGTVAAGMPLVALPVALVALVCAAAFRPDARAAVAQAWRRAEQARKTYAVAASAWEREARGTRFAEEIARLKRIYGRVLQQRRRHDAEIAVLQRQRDRIEWSRFVATRTLGTCRVRGVDDRTRALLAMRGVTGAAQISREVLHRMPELSRARRAALLQWREDVEREFRRLPKKPPDRRAVHDVKLRHARQRTADARALAEGAANLQRLAREIEQRRAALRVAAQERAGDLRRAEAETRISPIFYKTWT